MSEIFKQYFTFVDGVTSEASKDNQVFLERLKELDKQGFNAAQMLTAVMGGCGEGGEAIDLIKKVLFHGKPWDATNKEKMISEASDVLWYWARLCMALNVDPVDVIKYNVDKLQARYPGGKFSITASEKRIEDDLKIELKHEAK